MNAHEIDILIQRYLDGATTPAEERELALAVQREDRPAEWAIIAEMLGELTADEELYDSIMAQRELEPGAQITVGTAPRLVKLWPWAAAACVALGVGFSIHHTRHNTPDAPQETAHVSQQTAWPQADTLPAEPPHPAVAATKASLATAGKAPLTAPIETSLATADEALLPDSADLAFVDPDEIPEETPDTAPDIAVGGAEHRPKAVLTLAPDMAVGEQQLYQALLDELLVNIQQQSNRPELIL